MRQHNSGVSVNRRRFLEASLAAGAGMVALPSLAKPNTNGDLRVVDNKAARASSEPLELAIARWERGLNLSEEAFPAMARSLTEQVIESLGGMQRFMSRGDSVWITPNIGFRYGPEYAVNTNPDLVATLVRLCFDAGAKQVKVGCNAAYGARVTYPRSGIKQAVEAVGGEMVEFDPNNFLDCEIKGERLHVWPMYRDLVEADLCINAPIVKHHGLSLVTACMKNYMGMAGDPRYTWHPDLPTCLTDITAFMRPPLSVIDATRVLTANGPEGGELDDVVRMGIVAAGTDVVALDSVAAELLGLDPSESKTMKKAMERGLGHYDFRNKVRAREVMFV